MSTASHTAVEEEGWKSFKVCFDGFEGLPSRKGEDAVYSPEFTCFGHRWAVKLWPGGSKNSKEGKVSIYLRHQSAQPVEVLATFAVYKANGEKATSFAMSKHGYLATGNDESTWGSCDFAERATLISALQDGSLVINVLMKRPGPSKPNLFLPPNPLTKATLSKFMHQESSDLVFEVGAVQIKSEGKKKAKKEASTFYAHRLILNGISPKLREICESGDDTIPVDGVKPEIFHHILYHVYGGKLSEDVLKESGEEIIVAAVMFGLTSLKLEAEVALVATTADMTRESVVECLLFAEEHKCALLKEAALDFLVKNKTEAQKLVREGKILSNELIADLWEAFDADGSTRVNTLRRNLHEKGLDVDGTKEELIARLEANP